MNRIRFALVFALLLPARSALADQPGIVTREFVFETAPFQQCHASTIAQASDTVLVAAWFGGTREGRNDVGIVFARRSEQSQRDGIGNDDQQRTACVHLRGDCVE